MILKQIHAGARRVALTFSRKASMKPFVPSKEGMGIGGYALLSVPIATFCLGTWQVKRRSWKLNLIDEVKKQIESPPVDFPEDLEELSGMEYRRVRLRGTFDHSKELYIGPRQLMTENDSGGGLMSSRPQSGSIVITPFHVSDRNITVLVNRGWVPKNKADPAKRTEGQINEEIELTAVVRLPEKRPQFCPKNQTGQNRQFFYRDVPRMANMTGALPIYLDADASTTVPGGPIGGQTRISFRNEHLSYIVTWYSLSAATAFMWYRLYFHRIKAAV
ncbi:hypothetical protein JTE90_022033 [Oedothorax gibbosus]|uniref:SURF1-like protein n=1 Tax=Oedothorax gibbosus TaxID=931172 RepID=A0AAV6V0Z0_9ARAC|nr:hypothetical protein JTE90_022033 [Oedothorax gibbosus]